MGLATVRVLFGEVNPSGKLPESFPKQLADNPSYLFYGGEGDTAEYREGIFVGYRYYDRKETELLFPFGHGLSYTSFDFSDLRLSRDRITDQESLTATVRVTNTGKCAGKTVVQLYVGDCESSVFRPVRELKGFDKVFLEPGESKDVSFTLDKRSFAYWNTKIHDWHVESGEFRIEIGHSSRDIACCAAVQVDSTAEIPCRYDMNSIFMDLMRDPRADTVLKPLLDGIREMFMPSDEEQSDAAQEAISNEMSLAMVKYMPLRSILSFAGDKADPGLIDQILKALNE